MRVFLDGCFDLIHYGHANALYKAKCFGHDLVIGVHSDEDIAQVKAQPVFPLEERLKIMESFRWIIQIISSSPYVIQLENLDDYNCDFCAHADDITRDSSNEDCYRFIKASRRYLEYKRTVGISATDLIDRILKYGISQIERPLDSSLYPSARVIGNFIGPAKPRTKNSTVVYVDGAFDIYHVGIVSFIEKAKELGDYLIVGLYSDQRVRQLKGNYPICSIHERMMVLLANKNIDDLIIDAPFEVNEEFVNYLEIDLVCYGRTKFTSQLELDPYKYPREKGILKEVDSGSDVTTETIIQRVQSKSGLYEERNQKKKNN